MHFHTVTVIYKKERNIYGCIRILIFILLLFAISTSISPLMNTKAGDKCNELRVGLIAVYKNKPAIKVQNINIAVGYSIDNEYTAEQSFKDESGYVFTPLKDYFATVSSSYPTYISAKRIASIFIALGIKAYPVFYERGNYKVYICDYDRETVNKNIKKINELSLGYSFSTVSSNNNEAVLVTSKTDSFIIDGRGKYGYPQIQSYDNSNTPVINLNKRTYRGRIEIGRYGADGLTAVNIVNIEEYLYGVVPAEMNPSWEIEALKAQAVCARSYCRAKGGFSTDSDINKPYLIVDTVSDQVYKGYLYESKKTSTAVDKTRDILIYKNGKVISAFYFSTSGGRTENIEDVWGIKGDSYRSVKDVYETEPEFAPWIYSITYDEISKNMVNAGFSVGNVISVKKAVVTESGRVYSLRVEGTLSTVYLSEANTRKILGIPSTKFNIIESTDTVPEFSVLSSDGIKKTDISKCYMLSSDGQAVSLSGEEDQYIIESADNLHNISMIIPNDKSTLIFAGLGYGHGVGMSQSGAQGMAKVGFSYKTILKYYYDNVEIK